MMVIVIIKTVIIKLPFLQIEETFKKILLTHQISYHKTSSDEKGNHFNE